MTATYEQANDEMVTRVQDTWDAVTASVIGAECILYFKDVTEPEKPPVAVYWGRFSRQTVLERQSTLRNGDDKRYTSSGLIFVQIFAPMTDAQAAENLRLLAQGIREGFRAGPTPLEITFVNARINELNNDGKFLRCNVVSEYEYDEIG